MEDQVTWAPDELNCLSERELEVLKLVATGATNQQIARDLVISPNTVKVHLRNIYEKLGVQSRTEATMQAVRRGWVPVAGAAPVEAEGAAQITLLLPLPVPPPLVIPSPAISLWQRVYMLAVAVLVILALWAPGWWQGRSQALEVTPLSDAGHPPVAPAPRPKVVRWLAAAPLPEGRSRLALAAYRNKLYAIGGETAAGVTGEVTVFDPQSNGWLPGTPKPTPVANAGAALVDGLIYVPGGMAAGNEVSNRLEVYDPVAGRWTSRASLPAPLAAYALAVLDGRIYVFGGWDGARYLASTYVYDPKADKWAAGTSMPAPRAFLAAAALDNQIYVAGGYDGRKELDTVLAYDPGQEATAAGPWTARASLGQARGGLALLAVNRRLFAIGGGWLTPITFNEQYDVSTGAWSHIETPVTGQWRNLALAAQGNDFYALGGWNGSYLATVERYNSVVRILLPLGSKGSD